MIDRSKSPSISIRLSMLLMLLGICVFVWGLGYKLSLYEVHPSSIHQIPEAKLLSGNEDRNAAEGIRLCFARSASLVRQGSSISLLLLSLVTMAGSRTSWARHYFSVPKPWYPQLGAVLSALFLRPPPVFCRL